LKFKSSPSIRRSSFPHLSLQDFSKIHLKSRKNVLEFIAPLDNLLWDRKLISAIFDFDYKWEIYEPHHRRKYGYYVLPVLQNDAFVGRIEIINQKKTKTLLVQRFWQEKPVNVESLNQCIQRFAQFNQTKHIEYAEGWIIPMSDGSSVAL
jgi:uncharacterized protein YcaQ